MPKQTKVIRDFSGGLNTFGNPREIQDNELVVLDNFSVGSQGSLRTCGIGIAATADELDPYPTALAANQRPGHNVFSFSTDRHYNGNQFHTSYIEGEHWVASADHQGSNKVNMFGRYNGGYETISNVTAASDGDVTTPAHALTTASYVRFTDLANTMGTLLNNTIHKVKTVPDSTSLTIEEDTSAATYGAANDYIKGGQPGWILGADEPDPSDDVASMIDYAYVDGALRTSSSNFFYSGHTNKWWGYIDRSLFINTSATDSVAAEWYSEEAEISGPTVATFKDGETIGATPANTDAYDPALDVDSAGTDTHYRDETDMDNDLGDNPTLTTIEATVLVTALGGDETYSGFTLKVGISDDNGSSYYGGLNHTWSISGRGSSTRNLTWSGSWAVSDEDHGILSTLTFPSSGIEAGVFIEVTEIKLMTSTGGWTDHALTGNEVHVGVVDASLTGASGWDTDWEIGVSLLYDEINKQESLISLCTNETIAGEREVTFATGNALDMAVFINYDNDHGTAANNWRKRVTGCRVYMREIKSPSSSDRSEWFPQADCDFIKGEVTAFESGHTETAYYDTSGTQHIFYLGKQYLIRPHKRSTYEIESGVPEDEEVTMVRYKTSAVANRRLYVGNILVSYPDGREVRMGDTMIKSVVNKFDLLPLTHKIDVVVQDGDDIVRIIEYADRILQFKKRTLYIVNISQDSEYLEGAYEGKGVPTKSSVTKTDYGIAWINRHGCYLYNGRTIIDLLVNKNGDRVIGSGEWRGFINEDTSTPCSLGYSQSGKVLVVDGNADEGTYNNAYVYDFKTGAWRFQTECLPDTYASGSSHGRSNMVQRWDGEMMYGSYGTFYIFKDEGTRQANGHITTKDFQLAPPNKKVKLYNVYITYKTTDEVSSAVTRVRYATDGNKQFAQFNTIYKDASTVTVLASTFKYLKNVGTVVETDESGSIDALATVDTFTLDNTYELNVGDYITIESESEIMKVLEIKSSTEIKVQRGALDTTIEVASDNKDISRLCSDQARFELTTPVKCSSVQLDIIPGVTTYMEIEEIIFEYRPLFKEST
tara:strand:- start:3519 stop:6671 length:3153 start_codon:yes stop_codon:yes gene_type:complete